MFNNNVEPLENLIDQFAQFPGIGRKSAVRMAYQVMSMPPKQAMELAKACLLYTSPSPRDCS